MVGEMGQVVWIERAWEAGGSGGRTVEQEET